MKKLTTLSLLVFFLALPYVACAQSAKEALLALKKLNARCQAGISYKDYSPALGEAKFAVNLFTEGPEAKEKMEFTTSIETIMADYEIAQALWRKKLSPYGRVTDNLDLESTEAKVLLARYPEGNKPFRDGGALNDAKTPGIYIDAMLNTIWRQASRELQRASALADLEAKSKSQTTKDDIDTLKNENERLKAEIESLKKENEVLKGKTSPKRK